MPYRNAQGQFMTKFDYERTYGTLSEGVSVDLNDPEVQESIRDLVGPPQPRKHYEPIHDVFYLIWLAASAFAIFTAFFLGSLVYH